MTPAPSGKAMEIYAEVAAPMATRLAVDPELGLNISNEDWHFRWEETDKLGAWSNVATATKAITFTVDIPNYADESGSVAPFKGALTAGTEQFRFVYPLSTANNTIAGSIYTGYNIATQKANTKFGVDLTILGDKGLMVSNLMDVTPEATNYTPQMEQLSAFMQLRVDLKNGETDRDYKLASIELGTEDGTKMIPTTASIDLSKGIDEDGFMTATEGLLTVDVGNPNALSTGASEYLKFITLPFGVRVGDMMGVKISFYEVVDGISTLKTVSYTKVFDYDADYLRATHNGMVLDLDLSAATVVETRPWKGMGTSLDPYLIENEADLRRLAENATADGDNYKGVVFVITDDITLTSDWEPIGYEDNVTPTEVEAGVITKGAVKGFAGYINGDGHTIKNFNINCKELCDGDTTGTHGRAAGFVSSLSVNGTIVNLTIGGGTINGVVSVGAIAGYCHGTIKNCNNYCDINGYANVGGIAGFQNKKTVEGCKNYGTITATQNNAGGIVGNSAPADAATKIVWAENYGAVSGAAQVGGITGRLETQFRSGKSPNHYLATIDRAYNEGTITATGTKCGGIVGANRAIIYNAINKGTINGTTLVGGITGDHCTNNGKGGPNMNLFNYGDVTGTDKVGGIVGEARYNLKNVLSTGHVTATTGKGGAIMGELNTPNAKIFNSFYATGKLTAVTETDQTIRAGATMATNLVAYTDAEIIENAEAMAEAVTTTYADKGICTFWQVGDDGVPTIDIYALIITNHNLGGVKGEIKKSTGTLYWKDSARKSWGGGNGTEAYPYQLTTSEQVARLIVEVNEKGNDFDGKYFIITYNPMNFNPRLWERVGSPEKPFKGMIDFNDCSIKNIACNTGDEFTTDIQDVIYAENPEVQFYGNKPTQDYVICDRW